MHIALVVFTVLTALLGVGSTAFAQKRVALLIGNGDYTNVPALTNPTNDSEAIERLLLDAGFDVVKRADNLGLTAMRKALRDFSADVTEADIAVVYFAGHGIEVNGINYLIPVDAALGTDLDVEDEALPLERIIQILEPAKRFRLIILDACRDNPFVRSMKRTVVSRSIGRGLARVEVESADMLIAYAARGGSTAADGVGQHSPYTSALLNHLATPGLDVRLALGHVRDEVAKATGNRQEPFVYGSLGGAKVAIVEGAEQNDAGAPPPASERLRDAADAWASVKDSISIATLEALIRRFRGTLYADLARARVEELKGQQAAAAARAEVEREATERREESRRIEAARVAAAERAVEEQREATQRNEEERRRNAAAQLGGLSLFSSRAVPSFSCAEYAVKPIGHPDRNPQTDILCILPEAASADYHLGKRYRAHMARLSKAEKEQSRAIQREWILLRNQKCAADWDDLYTSQINVVARCLIRETQARAAQLH